MYSRSFEMSNFDKYTFLRRAICLVWIAGLSLGIFADRFYGEAFQACLLLAPHQLPSLFGTMCVNVFPLLISAYAVSFFPMARLLVCFGRGVLTGAGISGVISLFGQAGFGMCFLLLFSLVGFSPVYLWYCMPRDGEPARDTALCFAIAMAMAWLDWSVIAPFLREIVTF